MECSELDTVLRQVREFRGQLSARGVLHISVLGSIARGEAAPDSDVDFIIEPAPDRHFTLLDLAAVQELLASLLARQVDVITLGTLRRSGKGEDEAVRAF